jgi:hypothetical protein
MFNICLSEHVPGWLWVGCGWRGGDVCICYLNTCKQPLRSHVFPTPPLQPRLRPPTSTQASTGRQSASMVSYLSKTADVVSVPREPVDIIPSYPCDMCSPNQHSNVIAVRFAVFHFLGLYRTAHKTFTPASTSSASSSIWACGTICLAMHSCAKCDWKARNGPYLRPLKDLSTVSARQTPKFPEQTIRRVVRYVCD